MMDRHYRAFLLRCWQLGGERRFEIAHIQSGDTIRATTLTEVLAWIDDRLAAQHPDEEHAPAQVPRTRIRPRRRKGGESPR